MMKNLQHWKWSLTVILAGALWPGWVLAVERDREGGSFMQYGKMHEAIGRQQHEGRVLLGELAERPHFYGVGALEGLQGEATIYDGRITVTKVDDKGWLDNEQSANEGQRATLLAGAYVDSWTEHVVMEDMPGARLDDLIGGIATEAGVSLEEPFVFVLAGKFDHVHMHVINGACPIHARIKKLKLAPELRPYEGKLDDVSGRIVGVFAEDAVGDLTHPATSTHMHLLFEDPTTGGTVTGHVEHVNLKAGTVLRLPQR